MTFGIGFGVLALAIVCVWLARRLGRLLFSRPQAEADLPCAFGYKMAWIAIRTRDTARLIEALRLDDARSVNWADGIGAVYDQKTGPNRVFVTPPVDGWSFVVGHSLPLPLSDSFDNMLDRMLVELSEEFGVLQYYISVPELSFFGWAMLRDGQFKRAFACGEEGAVWNRGAVTAEEWALGGEVFGLREVRGGATDQGVVCEAHVLEIAGKWSFDPSRLEALGNLEFGVGYLATAPAAWRARPVRRAAA